MLNRRTGIHKTTKILVILVVLMFWSSSSPARAGLSSDTSLKSEQILTIQADPFLDQVRFAEAKVQPMAKVDPKTCATVRGGLVNHHVLASDLLWQFFERLAVCRPTITRLIILSPDHFFQGRKTASTAKLSYETQGITLTTDNAAIDRLLKTRVLTAEPKLFLKEHGTAALVPFAAQVFPHAQLVPIALRSDLSRVQANQLVQALRPLMDDETLLIVSSDMSHYLPAAVARKKDQETSRALQKDDQAFFWRAKDDHLDLGKGLWIALRLLKQPKFQQLGHGLSSDYAGSTTYTTSYFTGLWK